MYQSLAIMIQPLIAGKVKLLFPFITFLGTIIIILSVYNVIVDRDLIGIGKALRMVKCNLGFFVKLFFINLLGQILLFILVSLMLQQFISKEEAAKFLPTTTMLANVFFYPLSYIYLDTKSSMEKCSQ